MKGKSNRLIHESSPYLLQHAHNPVDWYPWGEEALKRAREEDKPILLSIGYSACHWCHVMERESFEKPDIAHLMNNHFVCIKLDREERPDIDQIYMDAIQNMGIAGGWPLNVFLTPHQQPFYGGTYFPPQNWAHLLVNIAQAFRENRQQLEESAQKFTEALSHSVVDRYGLHQSPPGIPPDLLPQAVAKLKGQFDREWGGTAKAPKFPMPAIWNFLWHFYAQSGDEEIKEHLHLTLQKMARGGIYDQIGGGFARYSVDGKWFAPHFEKMLYDNAQLVSLYSLAYAQSQEALYKEVVYQTIDFIERELTNPQGAFYAALDADSEGVEGKFYTWPAQEFEDIVDKEADFMADYYGVTKEGNWEDGRNILFRDHTDVSFAAQHQLDLVWMQNTLAEYKDKLLQARAKRIPPGLDDKIICGWNGLMIKGLTDAYAIFHEPKFLEMALACAEFVEENLRQEDQLLRTPAHNKPIAAYLEDYSAIIQGYIGLYQATFQEAWLYRAQNLTSYVLDHFFDEKENLFFYTDRDHHSLITRKKEVFDNVIPSSNSMMAQNLFFLGTILQRASYVDLSQRMVEKISPLVQSDVAYLSNWSILISFLNYAPAEVVIAGEKAHELRAVIAGHFHPHKVIIGTDQASDLPAFENRIPEKGTQIYVCYNRTCQLPTEDPQQAIEQLQSHQP